MEEFILNDLLGKLDLNKEQLSNAWEIYRIAVQAIKLASPSSLNEGKPRQVRIVNQIEVCRKNIARLIELLETYGTPCKDFIRNFPLWEPTRIETIKFLNKRVKSLNRDRKICNIVSVASNSVAAAGSATYISSLLCPGAEAVVAVVGMVATGVGGATSFATSIADVSLSKKHMKKAKKVCKRDKANFELLGDWITHTQQLHNTMIELMGFSIWKKMWKDLKGFEKERAQSAKFVKGIEKCVSYSVEEGSPYLKLGIKAAAVILTSVIAMILYNHRTQCGFLIFKLGLGILSGAEAGIEIGKLITFGTFGAGAAGAALVPRGFNPNVALGTLAGVGLAIEVTMIVLNSIELAKGKMCNEGREVLEVSKSLVDELNVLREVYKAMSE